MHFYFGHEGRPLNVSCFSKYLQKVTQLTDVPGVSPPVFRPWCFVPGVSSLVFAVASKKPKKYCCKCLFLKV